ncbi:neutral zinc metallopeptidase [Akkermansiaceae bacterium]|nr:neutral zinc metallopeptidase [Akkermansiaceae bacterium]MDB4383472.1 neutral zinc metallopeptidase [Akkermansiaceae bacterium]
MRLDNQRESTNVERRRGGRSKADMGGGVGTIVMALVAIFLFNEDPQKALSQMGQGHSQQRDAKPLTPRQEAMGCLDPNFL